MSFTESNLYLDHWRHKECTCTLSATCAGCFQLWTTSPQEALFLFLTGWISVGQVLNCNMLCYSISALFSQSHKNPPWDLDVYPTLYSIETFAKCNLIGFSYWLQLKSNFIIDSLKWQIQGKLWVTFDGINEPNKLVIQLCYENNFFWSVCFQLARQCPIFLWFCSNFEQSLATIPNSLLALSYAECLLSWPQQADFPLQIGQDLKLSPVTAPHFTLTLTDAQKDLTAGHWKQMYQKSILPQFYHQALDISEIILFNLWGVRIK